MSALITFYAFAFLITICSVMVVASRNTVISAVFLVLDLFLLAGIFAMQDAHFIAAIQVLVYAGAIVVLFMFVIMLLNLDPTHYERRKLPAAELGVLILTIVGFGVMAAYIGQGSMVAVSGGMTPAVVEAAGGNTYVAGMVLFTKYLWPFELASLLILLAIVASVAIARKGAKPKLSKEEYLRTRPRITPPSNRSSALDQTASVDTSAVETGVSRGSQSTNDYTSGDSTKPNRNFVGGDKAHGTS